MKHYIKDPYTAIFTGPTGCGKSHLVFDLLKKGTADILTASLLPAQLSRWNKPYYAKAWIRHDDKVWLIDKLY